MPSATMHAARLLVMGSRAGRACLSVPSPSAARVRVWPHRDYATSTPSSPSLAVPTSHNAASPTSSQLHDEDGRIVLYRGPCTLKRGWFLLLGGTFLAVGLQTGYNIYNHFSWPLIYFDETRRPELLPQWMRTLGACFAVTLGVGTSALIFCIPSRTVTRLSLDLGRRELVIRTAMRGFSALPPRILFPRALRRNAERQGWYLTEHNNERVVPLASVYRLRGSAFDPFSSGAVGGQASKAARSLRTYNKPVQQKAGRDPHRRTVELRVGNERLWYNVEAAGGAPPGTMGQKASFGARLSYWFRGATDWSDVRQPPAMLADGHASATNGDLLGRKQPWFSDRRTFDDIFPLVRRR